jgi:putative Mg2+ transporter-C (MgtC) family protein
MAELSVLEMVGRLLLAALLGAFIGAEREIDGQDAGLRTHLMLALGAALFGLISVGAWDDFFAPRASTNYQVDVTRVASYVAAGIGFIGAGTIVKQAGGVRGLTTAASLWVVAAVGLSCGVGFWIPAATATAVALVSLVALRPVRAVARRAGTHRAGTIVVEARDERAVVPIVAMLHGDTPLTPAQVRAGPAQSGPGYEIVVEYPGNVDPVTLGRAAERLSGLDEVASVHVVR